MNLLAVCFPSQSRSCTIQWRFGTGLGVSGVRSQPCVPLGRGVDGTELTAIVIHHYIIKIAVWDSYHQPTDYFANVPRIINFLNSDTMPWVNDTELHRLDKRVAAILENASVYDDLIQEYRDDTTYNLSNVLWRALWKWGLGDFSKLAKGGGLLHSPL